MSQTKAPETSVEDEIAVRAVLDRWSDAVQREDLHTIRADHDDDILIYDVPPPFMSRGIDAYMATWDMFFSTSEKPVLFRLDDIEVTVGTDVAFATAVGNCVSVDGTGGREPLRFRLTVGLRKIDGRWRITHEHHSLPAG